MRRGFLAFLSIVALSLVGVVTPPTLTPASALSGSEFDPGMIISDALFYDGNAMSAAQIQSFLDSKIGTCQTDRCLNVAVLPVTSRAASYSSDTGALVCAAIAGGILRTSELLYRTQVACGISAKVILVTLQKEQGLVTSRAPSDWALRSAMGMGCPDTAPCDDAFAGLANQIMSGARQLNVYKVGRFGRQPGAQYIQYHPNSACGGTIVNVRNYATAALYNYTPYQPNAAALANLGRTGDSCSSYGNRNFWSHFRDWFGSVAGAQYMVSTVDVDYLITRDQNDELWAYPVNPGGGWGLKTSLGPGWNGIADIVGVGDLDNNGYRDVVGRDVDGRAWFYSGSAALSYPNRKQLNVDWSSAAQVLYGGYVDAGKDPDMLTIDAAGDLWLWLGDGEGDFSGPTKVGSGFAYPVVSGVGDLTGDQCGDLLGIAPSGALMLHAGNCTGGFRAPRQIGTGFADFTGLYVAGDFTGDGRVDLWTKDAGGTMRLFRGTGGGAITNTSVVDQGWNSMQNIVGAGMRPFRLPSITSVSSTDDMYVGYLIVRDTSHRLWAFPGNAAGSWFNRVSLGPGWAGVNDIIGVGDLDGNGYRDIIGRDSVGKSWFYPGDGRLDYPLRKPIAADWSAERHILYGGYFDANADPDMLTVDTAGDLWLWPGDGAGGFGAKVKVAGGFADVIAITGVGDFDGDRCGDLVSITTNKRLMLHKGDCVGGLQPATQIGSELNGYVGVYSMGDFTDDGVADLWLMNDNGVIHLFRGTGGGAVTPTNTFDHGWGTYLNLTGAGMRPGAPLPAGLAETPEPAPEPEPTPTADPNAAGVGDLDGDGARDVLGVTSAGALRLYRGDGAGGVHAVAPIVHSTWGTGSLTVTLGDFTGDGNADVGRITAAGFFEVFPGDGAGGFTTPQTLGQYWSGFDRVFGMDFDGDGKQDILARDTAGTLWLYQGDGAGKWLTGNGIKIGIGWGSFTEIFNAGNFDGGGGADVIARTSDGSLWLYPTNGAGIWQPPRLIGIGWGSFVSVFSPGDFDGTGGTDVLARTADGRLYLYRGNGVGTWMGSRLVDSGWNTMGWIG